MSLIVGPRGLKGISLWLGGKESTHYCRRWGFDLWEESLEKEMATQSSILAWRIPWTEEPGRLPSMGSQKSQTHLRDNRGWKMENPEEPSNDSTSKWHTSFFTCISSARTRIMAVPNVKVTGTCKSHLKWTRNRYGCHLTCWWRSSSNPRLWFKSGGNRGARNSYFS